MLCGSSCRPPKGRTLECAGSLHARRAKTDGSTGLGGSVAPRALLACTCRRTALCSMRDGRWEAKACRWVRLAGCVYAFEFWNTTCVWHRTKLRSSPHTRDERAGLLLYALLAPPHQLVSRSAQLSPPVHTSNWHAQRRQHLPRTM